MKLNPAAEVDLVLFTSTAVPLGRWYCPLSRLLWETPILLGVGSACVASSRHMANWGRKPFLGTIYTRHHLNPPGCLGGVFPHRFV